MGNYPPKIVVSKRTLVGSVGGRANRLLARVCAWSPPSLYTQHGLGENKLRSRAQLPLMENKSNLENRNGVPGTLHLETVFPDSLMFLYQI